MMTSFVQRMSAVRPGHPKHVSLHAEPFGVAGRRIHPHVQGAQDVEPCRRCLRHKGMVRINVHRHMSNVSTPLLKPSRTVVEYTAVLNTLDSQPEGLLSEVFVQEMTDVVRNGPVQTFGTFEPTRAPTSGWGAETQGHAWPFRATAVKTTLLGTPRNLEILFLLCTPPCAPLTKHCRYHTRAQHLDCRVGVDSALLPWVLNTVSNNNTLSRHELESTTPLSEVRKKQS